MLCAVIIPCNVKTYFWYLLVLYFNFCQMSQICSKMVIFLFSAYFGGHFFLIATAKVKLIPDFYTWDTVLINLNEEIGEKHFFFIF